MKGEETYFHPSDQFPYYPISHIWMLIYGILSFAFFSVINRYLKLPDVTSSNNKTGWAQQNTLISFIHASMSSGLLLVGILMSPAVLNDVFSHANHFNYAVIAFSLGYFVWDFFDCLLNATTSIVGILVHHVAAILFFGCVLYQTRYVGLAFYGLSLEFNSVFLHARRLLRWYATESLLSTTNEAVRKIVTVANYVTFIIFRFGATGFGFLKLHSGKSQTHTVMYWFTLVIVLTVYYLNFVLFYRIVTNDIILNAKARQTRQEQGNSNELDEMLSTD